MSSPHGSVAYPVTEVDDGHLAYSHGLARPLVDALGAR